jgi:hypothetical protein
MFELWAKKRPVNGYGMPYEYITSFYDIREKYYMTDTLDREIYEECMVIENHRLIFYREFQKPLVRKLEKRKRDVET